MITATQSRFLATVYPELRAKFTRVIDLCAAKGVSITIHSSYRSTAHQTRLWNARKTNPNPVAKPGFSPHEWGVAIDATPVPRTAGAWKILYDTAEKCGLTLGVKFRKTDPPHFELPGFVHGSKIQKWPKPKE